jgi:hypothetical protein
LHWGAGGGGAGEGWKVYESRTVRLFMRMLVLRAIEKGSFRCVEPVLKSQFAYT